MSGRFRMAVIGLGSKWITPHAETLQPPSFATTALFYDQHTYYFIYLKIILTESVTDLLVWSLGNIKLSSTHEESQHVFLNSTDQLWGMDN